MRTIVLGDFHLHHGHEAASSRDFLALVEAQLENGPVDVVLSGDIYDLAMAGDGPVFERLQAIVRDQPSFHRALGLVIAAGGDVAILPGNHDYELLLSPQAFEALVPGARVQPWQLRVYGHTHVEHGNMYDPDNAHPDPLQPAGDPLGIMLTRGILSRLGDLRLLHTNGKTPLPVLWACFVGYGLRTPEMVARYISIGLRQCFAKKPPLPVSAFPRPTHLHGPTLFARMYLDRILTTLGFAVLLPFVPQAWPAFVAFMLLLSLRGNRYGGRVEKLLEDAAKTIAARDGVRHVVFGHAHKAHDDGVYLNTGSFGFEERTYVEIDREGARQRSWTGVASERRPRARSALYAYAHKRLGRAHSAPGGSPRKKRHSKG